MKIFHGLRKPVAVVSAAVVLGSTVAMAGTVLAAPALAVPIDTSSQSAFIRSVAPLAQEGQRRYRVPASVAIAQAILESGWGKSTLTTRGNAFFGIKCSRVMGPYATGCINMRTREVFNGTPTYIVDGFRTYANPGDSFKDHGRFLTVNSRYARAFNYPNDPKRFIAEVHRAGYATDPTYTAMIVRLMDQYNLYRFDTLPRSAASEPSPAEVAGPVAASESPAHTPTQSPSFKASPSPSVTASASPTTRRPVTASASPALRVTASTTASAVTARTTPTLSATASPTSSVTPVASPDPVEQAERWAVERPQAATSGHSPAPVAHAHPSPTETSSAVTPETVSRSGDGIEPADSVRISNSVNSADRSSHERDEPSKRPNTQDAKKAKGIKETKGAKEAKDAKEANDAKRSKARSETKKAKTRPWQSEKSHVSRHSEVTSSERKDRAPFDETTIRAQMGQDPQKRGALHPDGHQVTVHYVRPKVEYSGGLASTGW